MKNEAYEFGYNYAAGKAAYESEILIKFFAGLAILVLIFIAWVYIDYKITEYKEKKRAEKRKLNKKRIKKNDEIR